MITTESPDYAEVLRLHRKYRERDGDPLWKVFVRIGQELEGSTKKERCRTCHYTDVGYGRLVKPWCNDPWHGDAHLRQQRESDARITGCAESRRLTHHKGDANND